MLLSVVSARADATVYTNSANWNAAVSSATVVNYNDVAAGNFLGSPYTHDGVTLSNSNNYIFSYSGANSNPCPSTEGTCILLRGGYTNTVAFPGAEAGVAADFGITNASSGTLHFSWTTTAGHAGTYDLNVPFGSNGYAFFGLTADSGDSISSFNIDDLTYNTNFVIDNVSYSDSLATTSAPEPSSMLLLFSGLAGLGGLIRRRR